MDTPYVAFRLASVPSTQPEARARFDGVPTLVVADRQTAGHGRSGAGWVHADRAVAASLAFPHVWPAASAPLVTLVAGLAAVSVLGGELDLKWPNDLVLAGRKAGGVLVEASGSVAVAGLGVNLWWPDPIPGAVGVFLEDPGADSAARIAGEWASEFLGRLAAGPRDWGRDEYLARCETIGCRITWQPEGSGTAVDVDADGGLVVETAAGVVTLRSGAIRVVRASG